ncbi:MAG: hypothetical protein J7L71_03890 [Spirochaetaceae bacterium]|nr:hypothetical protein [Spirochaetaceae bacterium]
MQKEQNITIFHLQRKDGSSLFLHPFSDPEILLKLNDKVKIIGKYGKEPRVESLTMFRNDLYRHIEASVKSWISDIRFIPRFILSAAAFLVIYLFTSFVIRDPVPMIDELALSIGGSIALFFILAKRDQNSEKSSKRRLELRILIDKIVFEEDPFVKEIEEILYYNESVDKAALIESISSYDDGSFQNGKDNDIKQIVSYLDKIFSSRIYRKKIENLNKNDANRIVKWVNDNKIDLSLFAMYKKLKKKIYM